MNSITTKIISILPVSIRQPAGWIVFATMILSNFLTSCMDNAGVEYSSFVNIPENGIPENWEYEFTPVPVDSSSIDNTHYDLILIVRYHTSCKSKNVLLNLEEISLKEEKPDTLNIRVDLFNGKNEPLGKGNYSIYETADTLHKGMKIPEGYTISVSSPLIQNETVGIRSIGIVLSRSGSSEKFKLFDL